MKISTTKKKSIIRWAGSKRGALPDLLEHVPNDITTYVEPFAGSAVLYFALAPKQALLSDLNWPLVNFYSWLKADPLELHRISSQWERNRATFEAVRADFDTSSNSIESAARFYYLNANCFNGIYRTNRRNKFNVPFSGSRMAKPASVDEFTLFSRKLRSADFKCHDFRVSLSMEASPKHFFYIDPPYFVDDKRVFNEYGPEYFSFDDLVELADILPRLDDAGAKFLLSYADCGLARELFKSWEISELTLTRNVGGFKSSRRRESELIITNFRVPRMM